MNDFHFAPAVRDRLPLVISLAGASGTGKTRSGIRMARGMVGGDMGKVFVIDTENRRALHHVDAFPHPFMHAWMQPPFRPSRFMEGIVAAHEAGAGAIVIDSFSDEYEGEGGLQDMADDSGVSGAAAWKHPKLAHKEFLNFVRQFSADVPLIFCLRAEERIRIEPDPDKPKKTRVVPLGWMPVCEKRWMYDMGVSITLGPERPGRPDYDLPHKMPDWARPLFPPDAVIGEEAGAGLMAWARGAAQPSGGDEDKLPLMAPDGKLVAVSPKVWPRAVERALASMESAAAVRLWESDMRPILASVAGAGRQDLMEQAQAMIEARLDKFLAGSESE